MINLHESTLTFQVLCVPFIASNERVGSITQNKELWFGQIENDSILPWIDLALAMVGYL